MVLLRQAPVSKSATNRTDAVAVEPLTLTVLVSALPPCAVAITR